MKANEFIKKFGLEVAAIDLRNHEKYGTRSILYNFDDLKRLVESHDTVESCGGLNEIKNQLKQNVFVGYEKSLVRQAIADVESCQ